MATLEKLFQLLFSGKDGFAEQIKAIMPKFRDNSLEQFNATDIVLLRTLITIQTKTDLLEMLKNLLLSI